MGDRLTQLNGRVAVVTGASRGIGAAVARRLAGAGMSVACVARTRVEQPGQLLEGSLEQTVAQITGQGGRALAIEADLAADGACESVVAAANDAFGPVDALVNNAAVGFFGPLAELTPRRWDVSWRVSVSAPLRLAQLVLPQMRRRGAGRIVNVTSNSAIGPGRGPYDRGSDPVGDTAYGAQKAAIERLTQGLAHEVVRDGIGVAALAPSLVVATPGAVLNGHVGKDELEPEWCMPEAVALLLARPLEEVAGRVVYSQQLLAEHGQLDEPRGLGTDPALAVSGFALR